MKTALRDFEAQKYQQKDITIDVLPQARSFEIREINQDNRTIELSFSSEEPYERWWGVEILEHSDTSVDMTRLNNSAPLLFNHNRDEVIGVVEFAKIENSRGVARVRFGNSAKAQEVFSDVVDGIMRNVSVGYQILDMVLKSKEESVETYLITKWQPFEISIVSIPADNTVGVGRANALENKIQIKKEEVKKMDEDLTTEQTTVASVTVNAEEERAAAVNTERSRIAELTDIAQRHNMQNELTSAISSGLSPDKFRQMTLKKYRDSNEPISSINPNTFEIGLNEKELKQYSIQRALWALANPNDKRAQEAAAYEYELSQEAQARSGVTASGILVPFDVFKRDLTVAGTNGVTVATSMGGLIDLLKNKSAVMQLAEILPGLTGNISFPRQTSSLEIHEVGETETVKNSDIGLDQISMSPRRFAGVTAYSKQMLKQSSVGVENMITNDLLTQIALKIDYDAVLKILTTTGVGLVELGANGAAITNSTIVDMETEVSVDNADIGRLAYLINARTRGFLKKTPVTSGNPKMILSGADLNGYSFQTSNQIPANLTKGDGTALSALIFGNFADLLIGFWGGIDLTVDPYTESLRKQGLVGIQADQFADTLVRRESSFCVVKDAKVI